MFNSKLKIINVILRIIPTNHKGNPGNPHTLPLPGKEYT